MKKKKSDLDKSIDLFFKGLPFLAMAILLVLLWAMPEEELGICPMGKDDMLNRCLSRGGEVVQASCSVFGCKDFCRTETNGTISSYDIKPIIEFGGCVE